MDIADRAAIVREGVRILEGDLLRMCEKERKGWKGNGVLRPENIYLWIGHIGRMVLLSWDAQ